MLKDWLGSPMEQNNWYMLSEKRPPEEKNMLVWREKNRKFVVAYLRFREEDKDDGIEMGWTWITQHGSCHDASPTDYWLYFSTLYQLRSFE